MLQLLPGDGPSAGAALTSDPRIAGVCFTGSIDVARLIERQIAVTAEPGAMLIAETGGLNAMIVDSTALPEQAVRDVIASAFQSAGQRCSALRILYVQEDVEHRVLEMLKGALATLKLGDPALISTDVGPVIDDGARRALLAYAVEMENKGRLIAKLEAPREGLFVGPRIFRVSGIAELEHEVFGPILHVATFEADEIDKVIADINARGYGLTFGLHTRIEARMQHVVARLRAATSTSTATRSARWSVRSRSAARGFRAPAPKPADRTICAGFAKVRQRPSSPAKAGSWRRRNSPTACPT